MLFLVLFGYLFESTCSAVWCLIFGGGVCCVDTLLLIVVCLVVCFDVDVFAGCRLLVGCCLVVVVFEAVLLFVVVD